MTSLYMDSITIRRTIRQGDATMETEVHIEVSEDQAQQEPSELKTLVNAVIDAITTK